MFKAIKEKLKQLTESMNKQVDPSQFNDPLAMQTSFEPLKRGGSNFKTHQLSQTSPNRIEFKATIGAKVFYMIFLVAGSAILIGMSFSYLSGSMEDIMGLVIGGFVGLIFAIVGGSLLYFGTAPIVFDKTLGSFYKGRDNKKNTLLSNIHAVQLIREYCTSSSSQGHSSSYYSYELNLVLKDAQRINVIDHGNKKSIQDDALQLSQFLGVHLWDAL